MIICFAAFVVGVCLALFFPFIIQAEFIQITSVIVLCIALALAEAIRLILYKKLNLKIFISGFFCGLIFIILFIVVGENLDLDIYPIGTLIFSVGLIKSCIAIFRHFIEKNFG